MCSLNRMPGPDLANIIFSVALRPASGLRRRSSPFSSIRSKAQEYAFVVVVIANDIERSYAVASQPTASPSMMRERERRRSNVPTISGNRCVKSLPGRL
jgi:hypothetical protein